MLSFKSFIVEKTMAAVYNPLTHRDLTARGGYRMDTFYEKIRDSEVFLTKKGAFTADASQLEEIKAVINTKARGPKMKIKGKIDKRNVVLDYPNDFLKTPEFGGKGSGSGTAAEDRALTNFRKELEAAMAKEKEGVLMMKVGGRTVRVAGIESTPGTPKSDFHLVDDKGNEVAWLSHKDGTKASQFQQYGGLTKDWKKLYSNNSDVLSFIEAVKTLRPEGLQRGDSFWRFVKDNKVAKFTVWGPDHGQKAGRNNVDEFHQGTMKLVKRGRFYEIESVHKATNGEVPKSAGSGDYTAIYVARFTSDRGFPGLPNARVGVFARDYVSSKAKEI